MAVITPASPGAGVNRNRLPDALLMHTVLSSGGETHTDTRPFMGGPFNGRYFNRLVLTGSTSPRSMPLIGAGTDGVPVTPGSQWYGSFYYRRSGGIVEVRMSVSWYDEDGDLLSTTTGTDQYPSVDVWHRLSQFFTAPASAAFASPVLELVNDSESGENYGLAMAQFEAGGSLTPFIPGGVIEPLEVLNYGYQRGSRNVVLEPLGSGFPTVFLRQAQSRSGTMQLLFGTANDARWAQELLGNSDRFNFDEPAVEEFWDFIVTGPITVTHQTSTTYWIVAVDFREVVLL